MDYQQDLNLEACEVKVGLHGFPLDIQEQRIALSELKERIKSNTGLFEVTFLTQ